MNPIEQINLILALDACGFVVAELCPVLTIALIDASRVLKG